MTDNEEKPESATLAGIVSKLVFDGQRTALVQELIDTEKERLHIEEKSLLLQEERLQWQKLTFWLSTVAVVLWFAAAVSEGVQIWRQYDASRQHDGGP